MKVIPFLGLLALGSSVDIDVDIASGRKLNIKQRRAKQAKHGKHGKASDPYGMCRLHEHHMESSLRLVNPDLDILDYPDDTDPDPLSDFLSRSWISYYAFDSDDNADTYVMSEEYDVEDGEVEEYIDGEDSILFGQELYDEPQFLPEEEIMMESTKDEDDPILSREEQKQLIISNKFKFTSCSSNPDGPAGACLTDYLCSYTDEETCGLFSATFHPQDSCEDHGFTRFLEFIATGRRYESAPPMKVCIRQSNDEPDPNYCDQVKTSSMGHFGEYCIGDEEDGDSQEDCSSAGLNTHVKIPDSNGKDLNVCVATTDELSSSSRQLAVQCPDIPKPSLPSVCDETCRTNELVRTLAIQLISNIPTVGGVLAGLAGLEFYSDEDVTPQVLSDLATYFELRIAEVKSDTLLQTIKAEFKSLKRELQLLKDRIKVATPESPLIGKREIGLESAMSTCRTLFIKLSVDSINVLQSMPYISLIGTTCIRLLVDHVYKYEEIVGKPLLNDGAVELAKRELDRYVNDFVKLANYAGVKAKQWRNNQIENPTTWTGGIAMAFQCRWRKAWVKDNACPAVFGTSGPYGYGEQSCKEIEVNTIARPAVKMYHSFTTRAFADEFVEPMLDQAKLWSSMTSDQIDKGVTPSKVMKIAISPPGNFDKKLLNLGINDPKYNKRPDRSKTFRSNFSDLNEYRDNVVANWEVLKVEVLKPKKVESTKVIIRCNRCIIGIRFTYRDTTNGAMRTTTLGEQWGQPDVVVRSITLRTWNSGYHREVITAMNVPKVNDGFIEDFAIKTSIVVNRNGNRYGKMIRKDYRKWAVFIGSGSYNGEWIEAPSVAKIAGKTGDGYVPHIVAVAGWWSNKWGRVAVRWPVWKYQTYE